MDINEVESKFFEIISMLESKEIDEVIVTREGHSIAKILSCN